MKTSVNAGLYLRLSRDDMVKTNDESMSISNQRDLLIAYANERGWSIVRIYVDDGYTGTNFDRPDFNAMIEDIKAGAINTVITKDLSRLGRNRIESALHREKFLELGVRFIAIHDNYDGLDELNQNNNYDVATPIKEMMNEMYAAEVSRKVRTTKKLMAEQGKFSNSRAPYGYIKSYEDRHKLVVDEKVSHIVKRIYDMFLSGKRGRYIADVLNKEGIQTPNVYFYSMINKPNPYLKSLPKWGSGTIMQMLKNPVYRGAMAQGKRTIKSFKNKQCIIKPLEDWIVVENTHEKTVSDEIWHEAQLLIMKGKKKEVRRNSDGDISIFAGVIKCGDCGRNMTYDKRYYKSYTKEYSKLI